jgi:hypothetical protein
MLKEIPELRAPENSFTGIEIKPKVRYPDQTEAAIVPLLLANESASQPHKLAIVSLNYIQHFDAQSWGR